MTAYVIVTNGEIDQDSPATQPLFAALRDNPIAITEGAAGAPRILDAALDTTATATGSAWVRARIALQVAGDVGSYALLSNQSIATATIAAGTTVAGSSLTYAAASGANLSSPAGTWMCLGRCQTAGPGTITLGDPARATLFVRVS